MNDYYSIELESDELNKQIGGGLPKNSLIMIEGEEGYGKSILCQRTIYALLKKKVKVTYISSELNTLDFISQMKSINYDIREFILDKSLLFLTLVPFLGNVEFSENLVDKIKQSKVIFESDVIVIDTFSFLLVKFGESTKFYLNLINFLKNLTNLNKTVILTVESEKMDKKLLNMLREVVDLYSSIELKILGSQKIRILNIKRFKRPMDFFSDSIPFKVEPKEGLLIDIGSYS